MAIISDNASPINSTQYDGRIKNSLPYYEEFGLQILDILKLTGKSGMKWLDLGCGTGTLESRVLAEYPETQFVLADPSEEMLDQAKCRLGPDRFRYICAGSQDITAAPEEFDVVTAIQAHHYLRREERKAVTEKIFCCLKRGGIYFDVENVIPEDAEVKDFELRRWAEFRIRNGFDRAELDEFLGRCGKNYFPITIPEHIALLKEAGFRKIHVFWASYMQMGIYGVK